MAYLLELPQYNSLNDQSNVKQWLEKDGPFAKAFPIHTPECFVCPCIPD